jgi:tRNA:m4X modification enzyme
VLAAAALPPAAAPLPGPLPAPACVTAALAAAAAAAAAPHAVAPFCARHGAQQAGILAHMAAAALLPPCADVVYCELGAGRGYLSATLAESYDTAAVLLVERRSYRYKAERQLRRLRGVTVARLRCDVADLDLRAAPLPPVPPSAAAPDAAAPPPRRRRLVVTAKHLCGGGTDAALRCAARCTSGGDASSPALLGLAIAPCCHHACRWRVFCGKAALRAAGLGPAQFALATRMASWALDANAAALHAGASGDAGDGDDGDADADAASPAPAPKEEEVEDDAAAAQRWGISSAERVAVGAAVKALFDGARTRWATQRCGGGGGAAATLVRYCERHVSPENRLILLNTRAEEAAAAEA